jgi:hypothetical protein
MPIKQRYVPEKSGIALCRLWYSYHYVQVVYTVVFGVSDLKNGILLTGVELLLYRPTENLAGNFHALNEVSGMMLLVETYIENKF